MTQTLTHSILNDLGVPRHKDGNRLGIGSRSKIGTAQRSIKGTPRVYQPIENFRPNDLGNYRGKRKGWTLSVGKGFSAPVSNVVMQPRPYLMPRSDELKDTMAAALMLAMAEPKEMTQPELLARMLKVDAEQ